MSETPRELVAAFFRMAPDRVAEATEAWLAVEQGHRERLPTLRRLMHTIKGEAQMLGLEDCALLLERSEQVVDAVSESSEWPERVGDALLGAFELLGILAATGGELDDALVAQVSDELEAARAAAPRDVPGREPRRSAADPAPAPPLERASAESAPAEAAPTDSPEDAPDVRRAQQVVEVEELRPLVSELQRLESERTLLQPELRQILRAMRALERDPAVKEATERLARQTGLSPLSDLSRRLSTLAANESASEFAVGQVVEQLEDAVHRASVVPLSRLSSQIHRVARGVARSLDKHLAIDVRGEAYIDAAVERRLTPALLHLVRNAVDHGIEPLAERRAAGKPERGALAVVFEQIESGVRVVVTDDGAGIDFEAVRARLEARGEDTTSVSQERLLAALFEHGVTTRDVATEFSGRGVGLDVVASEVALAGGRVAAESTPGLGTRFVLVMPATLRVDVAVPLRAGSLRCAVPSRVVSEVVRVDTIEKSARGPLIRVSIDGTDRLVPLRSLAVLLGTGQRPPRVGDPAVVLTHPSQPFAVTVDDYETPRPLATQSQRELAFESALVRGVAPTPDGGVILVLDPFALHDVMVGEDAAPSPAGVGAAPTPAHVLVVEDAPVARELLCGILRSFGLRVSAAADGRRGLEIARRDRPDLVLSDIDMPVLGGLEMLAQLRRTRGLSSVPALILSNRVDAETRRRAASLGVKGFLSKQSFVEAELRERIDECLRG